MDDYIGVIKLFAGTYAPKGWEFCNGQLLSINRYTALYAILGTNYAGDGQSTFALPNLGGRVPVGTGAGTAGTNYTAGEMGGQENITLTQAQIPQHTHMLQANPGVGSTNESSNAFPAGGQIQIDRSSPQLPTNSFATSGGARMHPEAIGPAGGSQPHSNMQPFIGMNYIICLEGIFPPRP